MIEIINKFLKNNRGATIVEYSILAFFLSIAAVFVIREFGPRLIIMFTAALNAVGG